MSDLLEWQDIFYPRNFDHLHRKVSFSTPTPVLNSYSSPVVILSAEQAKQVGDEENQQYCPQSNAGPAARTPAGMAVVPSTEAENQY